MKTAGVIIALVLSVGGGLASLDSFYARRGWTELQFAQYDLRFAGLRLNEVDSQIVAIEKDRRRRRLTEIEDDLLKRLYKERKILVCTLKIERC